MGTSFQIFIRGLSSQKRSIKLRWNRFSVLYLGISLASVVIGNLGRQRLFANGLVFKNGLPEYLDGQHGRSLIGPGGVILDIPKIRVQSYKVRNSDPNIVSDELDCEHGECGDIVEPPSTKLHLGSNTAKEINEWSLPANVTQLVIECKSRSGVVEWEYEGNGIMSEIEVENTRHVGDFWASSTYLHVSLLTFNRISDHLTGKYTCKNVDKPTKSNSFYLFVPQPKSEVINDGRKIEVIPPSHADEVVLPCRMEKRQTPIYLFRKGPDGVYRKFYLKGSSRFDPYRGFILPVTPDVFGEFACKVDKKKKRKSREAPSLAMLPPSPPPPPPPSKKPENAPSPGFSAFPNSVELAEIIKTEEDATLLASLLTPTSGENPTVSPDMAVPPIPPIATSPRSNNMTQDIQEIASFKPYRRKNTGRRRKRPLMRRRNGPGNSVAGGGGGGGGVNTNIISRRGGPPHMGAQLPIPPRGNFLMHRRPVYHRPPPGLHTNSPLLDSHVSGPGSLNHPLQHSHYYGHQIQGHHLHGPALAHSRLPPGAAPPPSGILPTFTTSGTGSSNQGHTVEEKLHSSLEDPLSTIPQSLNPYQSFIAETLMSRVDTNRPPMYRHPTKKPVSLFPQNLLPPTMTVVHTMQCVLKKMVLGADVPCNASLADGIAERHGNTNSNNNNVNSVPEVPSASKEHKTILEIALLPPPENKFYPVESTVFTTSPFFVKWETRFTDYANWAEPNHTLKDGTFKRHRAEEVADFENGINALEVFEVPEGETGNITVTYMGGRKQIRMHTWHYYIINGTTFTNKGLKQTIDGVVKVFMCRSATSKRPILSLSRLTENGCPEQNKDPFSGVQDYTEEDCGLGCSVLRTKIDQGIVKCVGDGVDQTLMFPDEMQCTGRPYFIDRGQTKNLTLTAKGNRLLIPCVINNPNADVYLFHELNGVMTEVTDNSTYDLKAGFYLDTSTLDDPYGLYFCTSTPDTDDETDMVRFYVKPLDEHVFYPPQDTMFGTPPFKFMWESVDELEVSNASIGKFDKGMFAKTDGSRPHVGTFELFSNVTAKVGSRGEIRVIRKSDRKAVHTWHFKHTGKIGLSLDKEKNLFRCQAATENQPMLYAVSCDNPNVCKLERKFMDDEDDDIKEGRDNSHCGDGCVQLKIWRNRPLGFVRCKGDGVDETLQYFMTENSTMLTEEDKSTIEQFKQPEILNGVRRLRVGETADFICKANRYFYSKGFQWAIETKNGQKKFIDAKVREDVFVKDEVRSIINLKILDAEWKRVWCYTPELTTIHWANVSQPIYLR